MRGRLLRVAAAATALVAWAQPALACAVCYGDSDSPWARAADLSILFMAILTYGLILGGGALFFFVVRSRARRTGSSSPDGTRPPGTAEPVGT